MPSAIVGAVASGLVSRAINGGGRRSSRSPTQPVQDFRPSGFSSAGLNVTPNGNVVNLSRGGSVSQNLGNLSGAASTNLNELAALRSNLNSGFSQVNDANTGLLAQRVGRIRDASRAALGNLRDNLARRRIAGSSFAADALSRAEAEFAREESLAEAENAQLRSQNVLAQVEAETNLINQEFQTRVGQFSAFIDQANFESGLGAQITSGVTSALQRSAETLSNLRAQEAAGRGAFLQPVIDAVGSAVGRGVENIFSNFGGFSGGSGGGSFLIPNSSGI